MTSFMLGRSSSLQVHLLLAKATWEISRNNQSLPTKASPYLHTSLPATNYTTRKAQIRRQKRETRLLLLLLLRLSPLAKLVHQTAPGFALFSLALVVICWRRLWYQGVRCASLACSVFTRRDMRRTMKACDRRSEHAQRHPSLYQDVTHPVCTV